MPPSIGSEGVVASAPGIRRRRLYRIEPEAGPGRAGWRTGLAWVAGVSVLGMAWLVPETIAAAALGWIAALLIAYAVRSGRGYRSAYVAGMVGHVIGFHWVYQTVAAFGGFGVAVSAAIFLLFVGLGAVQFLAIAVIDRHLNRFFDALGARTATAVVLAELLTPRVFPWHFGHTQIAFTPFVQAAGVGGAMAVTFLMFWMAEVAVRVSAFGERRRSFLLPAVAFGASIAYGLAIMDRYGSPRGEPQEVVVAQANLPGERKRDLAFARQYAAHLFELSQLAAHPGSLVVWPEGAVPIYYPAGMGTVGEPARLPCAGDGSAYLVGGFSYTPDERKFNTAFAIYPDGAVPTPYFKRVLIPFGEYMPMASFFPWLGRLNARAGVFTAGTEGRVFDYPMRRPDGSSYALRVSPLICYEDTVPALAREAAGRGAGLLVNITSDYWFGRSLAPAQHHLIAAFRAIENRRYLVRSTTTGLTAIVDPLGRTIGRITPFTEGTVTATVRLLDDVSPYTAWVGDRPWWALLAVVAGLAVAGRLRAATSARRSAGHADGSAFQTVR